jgi:signal transduction histidine kinase
MQSFLGVPIVSKGRIFGNLYLTDKLPDLQSGRSQPTGFSQEDQEILEMFANQAAIAIENAQLYRQNQQIAVLQERERFGMDLHDGVIQSIYAIGLMLDASRHQLHHSTADAAQGIESALRSLDQVIKDIRAYIHDLRAQQVQGRNLQQGLEDLARQLQTYSVLTVDVTADPAALQRLTPAQTSDMLQIAREALSNIRKHAHATEVTICVSATPRDVVLTIEDNGSGLDNGSAKTGGYGLNNMAARARHLNGELTVASLPTRGTRVSVAVPV